MEEDIEFKYLSKEPLRRSRLETYVDILRAIAEGSGKPTHIMYRANLSWVALQSYLKSLIKRNLISVKEIGGRKIYELTDEGYRVMNYFFKIKQSLDLKEISV
jgi:predicted transcriptional regulator